MSPLVEILTYEADAEKIRARANDARDAAMVLALVGRREDAERFRVAEAQAIALLTAAEAEQCALDAAEDPAPGRGAWFWCAVALGVVLAWLAIKAAGPFLAVFGLAGMAVAAEIAIQLFVFGALIWLAVMALSKAGPAPEGHVKPGRFFGGRS